MVVRQLQRALSHPNLVWVGRYTGNGLRWLDKVIDGHLHASLDHVFDPWSATYQSLCNFESQLDEHHQLAPTGRTILPYTNGPSSWSPDLTKNWLDSHHLQLCATCLSILVNLEDQS